jgi:hypothetical protein
VGSQLEVSSSAGVGARVQELGDRGPPVVEVRGGRHGQPRVVGEKRDDTVDVVAREGLGEPACQGAPRVAMTASVTFTGRVRALAGRGRPGRVAGVL